jgi:glutamine phosphoribosylpyrophosphate amidotransferase
MPLVPAVAMTECRVGDDLHRRLRGYKDAPVAEVRRQCAAQLASLVARWLGADAAYLRQRFGSTWDVVATVPSSRRPAGAPVDAVVSLVPQLDHLHRPLLVRGPAPTGHLAADRRGFALDRRVDRAWLRDRRVLVVEDSTITGARAQSAAAALRLAGARVVGVVAISRVVSGNPVPPDRPPG